MLNRILVGLIGIPILMYIYYTGGMSLLIFTNLIIGIGLYEFYRMAKSSGKKPFSKLGILFGLTIPNIIYFSNLNNIEIPIFFPSVFLLLLSSGRLVFNACVIL